MNQGNPGKKILLVDDEPSVAKAIKMLLEHDGYGVQIVNSGEAALALYECERFDLIITDFSMPGMTGGELAGRIKKIRPDQPIIMATASIYTLDAADHPGRLVNCVLDKPFTLQDLRAAIARIFPA
ncbi:MAG TPA: response regulator [Verrucomicrobiae bacterium]|nr:response regulator [Verrucomicrobiae bacterium]